MIVEVNRESGRYKFQTSWLGWVDASIRKSQPLSERNVLVEIFLFFPGIRNLAISYKVVAGIPSYKIILAIPKNSEYIRGFPDLSPEEAQEIKEILQHIIESLKENEKEETNA